MGTMFLKCTEDFEYEKYIRFYITHRNLMTLTYSMDSTLNTLSSQIRDGHIILGLDSNQDPIATLAYFYGDPDDPQIENDNLLIQVALLKKEYQRTTVFLQGFQFLINEIIQAGNPVTTVTFYADSSSTYLKKLYSKFANHVGNHQGPAGEDLDIYTTKFEDLKKFIQSFDRKNDSK